MPLSLYVIWLLIFDGTAKKKNEKKIYDDRVREWGELKGEYEYIA